MPSQPYEYDVVRFGGSEDLGHFEIPQSGPDLPGVLKAPWPPGVLNPGIPLQLAIAPAAGGE
jgi:hypothetical protein